MRVKQTKSWQIVAKPADREPIMLVWQAERVASAIRLHHDIVLAEMWGVSVCNCSEIHRPHIS